MTTASVPWVLIIVLAALLLPGRGASVLLWIAAAFAALLAGVARWCAACRGPAPGSGGQPRTPRSPATYGDIEALGSVRLAPGSVREAPAAARHPTTTRDSPGHSATHFGPDRQAGPAVTPPQRALER
jgi:hypothetical protein